MQSFLADIPRGEAGELRFGHVLRSPVARGRIRTLRAQPLPEGYLLVRARDIPGARSVSCAGFTHPVLGDPRVHYRGQPYALLCGPDRDTLAELAAEVRVEWEELPRADGVDPDGGPGLPGAQYRRGDPDKAFTGAFQIVEAEYTTERRRIHDPDLTAAFVQVGEKGLTVYVSTQDPFGLREAVAAVLKVPARRIRVIASRLANPMEGKFLPSVLAAAHAAVLAAVCRKAVWLSTEAVDNHRYCLPGPGFRIREQTALDRHGNLMAVRLEMELEAGAYAPAAEAVLLPAVRSSLGGYRVPNLEIKATTVCSSRIPTASFRAAGRAQAFFAAELNSSRVEEIAEVDPYTWKSRNLLRRDRGGAGGPGHDGAPGEKRPEAEGEDRESGTHGGGAQAVLDAVVTMANFQRKHASFAALKKRRTSPLGPPLPLRGIGMAVGYQERQDPGVFVIRPGSCTVKAVLDTDKRLHLYTSLVDHGPGIHALFASRAASLLELDPEKVRVEAVDTQVVPDTGVSTLGRALAVGLPLVEQCCQAIKLKRIKGPLPIEVRRSCREQGPESAGSRRAEGAAARRSDGPAFPLPALADAAWAATVVEVEVDPATLQIALRGIWTAVLCGRLGGLPDAEGYLVGEVIRAAGWACLAEHASVGGGGAPGTGRADAGTGRADRDQGLPAWGSGSLPRLSQIPPVHVRFVQDPNPAPRGFEQLAHLTVPPAYAAAVSQATGLYVDRIPITPEVLQECLEA
ncbi:MAG: xanthine dehydrogenase family protein molybdopterin-binding subunit [Spirochaetales bacterium]|nr:xanthine dehydrogenase family protein molybdopterin-binding subunit [Spirochaetales bacterium]